MAHHQTNGDTPQNQHTPVLLQEVLHYLAPQPGNSYVDMTAGYGGHARAVLARTQNPAGLYLVDRDPEAISALQSLAHRGAHVMQTDFMRAAEQLVNDGRQFDLLLADLGVSSVHLDTASRGFSFRETAKLDMRMDTTQALTAAEVVNNYPEAELSDILWRYGEEPKARQIARLIVAHRPYQTTQQLAQIVAKAWPGHSKVHPATRTFQAVRIVVNDELGLLERALPLWIDLLKTGGRLAIISFHSLEDRIVKRILADYALGYEARLQLLTKRPVMAGPTELVSNPRSRSAKLRAAAKINMTSVPK